MYKDLEILQKLHSLINVLSDKNEIEIIRKLISKRQIEIDLTNNFSLRDLSRMTDGVRKCYFDAIDFCIEVYDKEIKYDENFEKEIDKKFREFEILKCKIHQEKNTLISRTAKESLKIIMKEEFIKTILKY